MTKTTFLITALVLGSAPLGPAQAQDTRNTAAPSATSAMTKQGQAAAMQATLPRDPALKPIFDDFGGKAGLVAIVDDLMINLMADPRTHRYFAKVDRERVKEKLVEQFCVILAGPCTYTGDDMKVVHRGLNIQRADFNALVEDLQAAMDKHDVPFRAQNKLLAKLAPMHRIIDKQ